MKSIELKTWYDSKEILSQLPCCPPKTVAATMNNGIQTFSDVENADARTIESVVSREHPGFGNQLKEALKSLPSEVPDAGKIRWRSR